MSEPTILSMQRFQYVPPSRLGKSAVITCVANEYHQIGAKMVADIFELNGWRGYFVKGLALVLFTVFSFAGCNSATLPARHQSSRFA